MKLLLCLAGLLPVAVVQATYPMITVDSAGTIAAQSNFRHGGNVAVGGGFSYEEGSVTLGTNTYTGATLVSLDKAQYKVLTSTSGTAVRLPMPVVGATLRFIADRTIAWVIKPFSTSYSINGAAGTDFAVAQSTALVSCAATSVTDWDCASVRSKDLYTSTAITASTTLTTDQIGSIFVDTSLGAFTITLPTCSSSILGTKYDLIVQGNTNTVTFSVTGSDRLFYTDDTTGHSTTTGGQTVMTPANAYAGTGASTSAGIITGYLQCQHTNIWAGVFSNSAFVPS